jgi:small conductance mechanosensitive channel
MNHKISKVKICILLIVYVCSPIKIESSDSECVPKAEISLHEKPSQAPEKIEVNPNVRDEEISKRLESILQATNWFTNPQVKAENGVVFIGGETRYPQFKNWAEELAHNTQDVAAIVNKIAVVEPSIMDLDIIMQELLNQGRKILKSIPAIILSIIILFLSWLAARATYKMVPIMLRDTVDPSLLNQVIARTIGFSVFLIGIYFLFEVSELTTMALTVVSGTGLMGIILGIAFRDLAENFLASILLSLQNPFHQHDLIDLICPSSGYTVTGYVERLTMRATILVSVEGNHVQIPNATVYKSNIVNHSSNPNHREKFSVSIKSKNSISPAVDFVLKILSENEAILTEPEPLVLVEGLDQENVNLQICYWINIKKAQPAKVKSLVLHQIKQVFQAEGIYQSDQLNQTLITYSQSLPQNEGKTTEVKTKGNVQSEKFKGLASELRLPEQKENLLGKINKQFLP